jgi:predicted RNase H-like nuclease (RuvC/YqgF family)
MFGLGTRRKPAQDVVGSIPTPKSVVARLEELEDGQQRLERRFERIQNEFNISVRRQRQLERENDDLRDELENTVDEDGE